VDSDYNVSTVIQADWTHDRVIESGLNFPVQQRWRLRWPS
jgi:hypothetical protein